MKTRKNTISFPRRAATYSEHITRTFQLYSYIYTELQVRDKRGSAAKQSEATTVRQPHQQFSRTTIQAWLTKLENRDDYRNPKPDW